MDQDTEANIRREMQANSAAFAALVLRTHQDATRIIMDAARQREGEQEKLLQRLMTNRVAMAMAAPTVGMPSFEQPQTESPVVRRSARSAVLRLLADAQAPVSGNALDAAVIAEGWSKAASDKIKSKLKNEGLTTVEKRFWRITDEGRHAVSE